MKCLHFGFAIALLLACYAVSYSASAADAEPKTTPIYTATAVFRILHTPPHMLTTSEQKYDPAEFESFKLTQAELVKSPFVIIAALRTTPEIIKKQRKGLPSLQHEEKERHAVAWLGKKLRVKFPSPGSELMTISLTLPDAEEAATLVNAVVRAYFDEVVNGERLQKKQRYSDLQTFSAENENTLRTKRTELRQLAENLGVIDGQAQAFAETLEGQMCLQIQTELMRMKFACAVGERRTSELTVQLEQNKNEEISPMELVSYLQQTSTEYRDLLQKKIASSMKELTKTTDRIEEVRKEAVDKVRVEHRIAMERELKQLQNDKRIWANQIEEVKAELETRTKAAFEKSRTSIDVEMKQADIANLERLLQNVNSEKDRLKVELKAPPRIEIMGDVNNPADVPESPDKPKKKMRRSQ